MLPPLDTRKINALLRDGDEGEELECDPDDHIGMLKGMIAEDRNWSEGVLMLLELWPRTNPRFYRKKPMSTSHPLYRSGGPNNWWIELNNVYFGPLRLKPSSGGVINIYTFGEYAKSFQIMGCRQNWVAMISWIWEYANNLDAVKRKSEGSALQALVYYAFINAFAASNFSTRANDQRRRVEKPLLHQVLHPAKFKAQHGRLTKAKAKELAAAPKNPDSEMHDVDASSTASDMAISCGNTSLAIQTMGMRDDHRTPDATAVDIDFEALDVVDHDS
ncbi:hypothetical protein HO133_000004 [Letharia lupina]|uniref:Uncharacterized protein n=1 Tax=Letharia lupina TaxID=560253 RepID=A0A8H6L085_9LECA|nr:uncharacterized protein HO133_000004 [Letharia lupina]KAF6230745.1 hypothetical protein HO133_000004 [Letharia lupina]